MYMVVAIISYKDMLKNTVDVKDFPEGMNCISNSNTLSSTAYKEVQEGQEEFSSSANSLCVLHTGIENRIKFKSL